MPHFFSSLTLGALKTAKALNKTAPKTTICETPLIFII